MNAKNCDEAAYLFGASSERISTLPPAPSRIDVIPFWRSVALSLVVIAATAVVEAQGAIVVTHYDVSTVAPVADGTTVAQFVDISGNNNHATGSGGTYLLNGIGGLPSVRFTPNNLDDGYHSTFSMGSQYGIQGDAGWTQVFVVRLITTYAGSPTARPIFGGLGNGYTFGGMAGLEIENAGPASARFDVSGGNSTDVVLNPPNSFSPFVNRDVIITVTHRGNTGESMLNSTNIYINGDAPGEGSLAGNFLGSTGAAATTTLNLSNEPISLGTTFVQGYVGFDGLLAEVIVYDGALTDVERRQRELILAQKYDIVGIPEPSSLLLSCLGMAAASLCSRRPSS